MIANNSNSMCVKMERGKPSTHRSRFISMTWKIKIEFRVVKLWVKIWIEKKVNLKTIERKKKEKFNFFYVDKEKSLAHCEFHFQCLSKTYELSLLNFQRQSFFSTFLPTVINFFFVWWKKIANIMEQIKWCSVWNFRFVVKIKFNWKIREENENWKLKLKKSRIRKNQLKTFPHSTHLFLNPTSLAQFNWSAHVSRTST